MKKLSVTQEVSRLGKAVSQASLSKEAAHKRAGQLLQVTPRSSTAKSHLLALWRKTL